jgi:hypothetical protein
MGHISLNQLFVGKKLVITELKYVRSVTVLQAIKQGIPVLREDALIQLLSRKGFIARRPGRIDWGADCYDLTIKAEKMLEEYYKMEGFRGGSRPSEGHLGR